MQFKTFLDLDFSTSQHTDYKKIIMNTNTFLENCYALNMELAKTTTIYVCMHGWMEPCVKLFFFFFSSAAINLSSSFQTLRKIKK